MNLAQKTSFGSHIKIQYLTALFNTALINTALINKSMFDTDLFIAVFYSFLFYTTLLFTYLYCSILKYKVACWYVVLLSCCHVGKFAGCHVGIFSAIPSLFRMTSNEEEHEHNNRAVSTYSIDFSANIISIFILCKL